MDQLDEIVFKVFRNNGSVSPGGALRTWGMGSLGRLSLETTKGCCLPFLSRTVDAIYNL